MSVLISLVKLPTWISTGITWVCFCVITLCHVTSYSLELRTCQHDPWDLIPLVTHLVPLWSVRGQGSAESGAPTCLSHFPWLPSASFLSTHLTRERTLELAKARSWKWGAAWFSGIIVSWELKTCSAPFEELQVLYKDGGLKLLVGLTQNSPLRNVFMFWFLEQAVFSGFGGSKNSNALLRTV